MAAVHLCLYILILFLLYYVQRVQVFLNQKNSIPAERRQRHPPADVLHGNDREGPGAITQSKSIQIFFFAAIS